MTKKFRIWGLVQDRLSPVFVIRKAISLTHLRLLIAKERVITSRGQLGTCT